MTIPDEIEGILKARGIDPAWCELALVQPAERCVQDDGRIRIFVYVQERDKYLRVILRPDGETLRTAFFDRNYLKRVRRQALNLLCRDQGDALPSQQPA
jgi:hypothetical protein